MAYTYILTTDVGKIRLLIPDRVEAEAIFQDDEIEAFLLLEGSLKAATALALETVASDEVLVQKVMKLQQGQTGIQTDGARVAEALLKRAKELRAQAAEEAAAEDDGTGYFDIAEQVVDVFSAREHLWNVGLRNG